MGQAAKSDVAIYLIKGTELPLELSSATALEQALLQFYKDTRKTSEKPSITIVDFKIYDEVIELELYSTRSQNLDFQVELLQEYLEPFIGDTIEEITEDTWLQR